MPTLTNKDIDHIAHLAKLTIPEKEHDALVKELNKILDMVNAMSTVNTDDVPPLMHPYDEKQPLRSDKITEKNQRQLFQSIAPHTEAGLYIVPAVIENE